MRRAQARWPIALALGAAIWSGTCSQNADPPAVGADAARVPAEPRPAKVLPLPEAAGSNPTGSPATNALAWDVPAGWMAERPSSSMRRAQYRVPGEAGDAECVVFYFGPGQGGDAMANAVRWAGQFEQPDGSSSVDAMRVTELEGASIPVRVAEVSGTYDGGMTMTDAPAERRPNYRLLGGIAQAADAPWFFKLTGPDATVRANREAFLGMMRSLRAGS
jgi:hypothetical protein